MKHVYVEGFDVIEAGPCSFYEAQELVEKANSNSVCGHTDWIMPKTPTLKALAKLKPEPFWVWSASPYADYADGAWYVYFGGGYVDSVHKDYEHRVRLVRESQHLAIEQAAQRMSMKANGEM